MTDQDPLHPSMSPPGEVGPAPAGHGGLGPGFVQPGEMAAELPAAGTAALATGVATRRRRGVRVTTAAAVALGLAVAGGVAGAASASGSSGTPSPSGTALTAQSNGPAVCGSPPAAVGTVKSVGSDSFVLTTADGSTVTVDVGSSTTYVDPGVSAPSLSNVTVGEHVAVMGTESSNTVTATSVLIGLPQKGGPGGPRGFGGPGGPPAAVGTVKSVDGNSFVLTTPEGSTVTVDVSSSTKYLDPGVSSPSLSNVTVGEHVAVMGTESSNTVTATTVLIGAPPFGGPPPSGSGSSSNNTSANYSVSGGPITT